MYSLVKIVGRGVKKAKGVNKSVVRGIVHKEFIDVLYGKGVMRHWVKRTPSKLHKIGTCNVSKISLPCFDTLNDGINSLFSLRLKSQ